jgi:hypothetical protein
MINSQRRNQSVGSRTRKILQRDANGKIMGFVDRREGADLVWRRDSLSAK